MPYNPDGSFTLNQTFGTGTAPDNQFPPAVGNTLDDIASSLNTGSLVPVLGVHGVLTTNNTATLAVGFTFFAYNAGTLSSGNFTVSAPNGNYQYLTNNGAHTWAAPVADSAIDVLVTNGASAGTIAFSGYTTATGNTGDPFTTANGNKFIVSVRRINSTATYVVKALQ